jgi:hypothetical protein
MSTTIKTKTLPTLHLGQGSVDDAVDVSGRAIHTWYCWLGDFWSRNPNADVGDPDFVATVTYPRVMFGSPDEIAIDTVCELRKHLAACEACEA